MLEVGAEAVKWPPLINGRQRGAINVLDLIEPGKDCHRSRNIIRTWLSTQTQKKNVERATHLRPGRPREFICGVDRNNTKAVVSNRAAFT